MGSVTKEPAGLAVQPLDFHLVNVGSIPTGPTHGEGRLQPHPGDVLKFTPNVRKSPRSGLNLEERLSDPQLSVTSYSIQFGPRPVLQFQRKQNTSARGLPTALPSIQEVNLRTTRSRATCSEIGPDPEWDSKALRWTCE